MNSYRKLLVCLLAVVMSISLLAACGSRKDNDKEKKKKKAAVQEQAEAAEEEQEAEEPDRLPYSREQQQSCAFGLGREGNSVVYLQLGGR